MSTRFEDARDTVLDHLMAGVMLFCGQGQLVYSNAAVSRYGRQDLLPPAGRYHYSQLGNIDLRDAIGAVLRDGMAMTATFPIQSDGTPPLVATVMPAGAVNPANPGEMACAVCLSPAHLPFSSAAALMGRAYQLTAAETRVLRHFLDGMARDEVANRLGVKRGTVAAHLKSVFNKVDVQSQSDLVRVAWQMSPAAE